MAGCPVDDFTIAEVSHAIELREMAEWDKTAMLCQTIIGLFGKPPKIEEINPIRASHLRNQSPEKLSKQQEKALLEIQESMMQLMVEGERKRKAEAKGEVWKPLKPLNVYPYPGTSSNQVVKPVKRSRKKKAEGGSEKAGK